MMPDSLRERVWCAADECGIAANDCPYDDEETYIDLCGKPEDFLAFARTLLAGERLSDKQIDAMLKEVYPHASKRRGEDIRLVDAWNSMIAGARIMQDRILGPCDSEKVCGTCGGKGKVEEYRKTMVNETPCPDCQPAAGDSDE